MGRFQRWDSNPKDLISFSETTPFLPPCGTRSNLLIFIDDTKFKTMYALYLRT